MSDMPQPYRLEDDELFDLPIAVYLVKRDGTFISGNRRLRKLFRLPEYGSLSSFSIVPFYRSPADREELIRKADEAEKHGGMIEKETAAFKIHTRDYFLQMYCRKVHRGNGTAREGYLGCLVDVTEEEMLRILVEELPAGIYRTDEHGNLLHFNQAIMRIFGCVSRTEVEGRPITDFVTDPSDISAFQALSRGDSSDLNRISEVIGKTDRRSHQVSIRSIRLVREGKYAGHEGTIEDVTEREQLRDLIQKAPLGLYKVALEDGKLPITYCNDSFAHLFGFADASQVMGKDIRDIQTMSSDYDQFLSALHEQDAAGRSLLKYVTRITPLAKSPFTAEVNCRLLRDQRTGKEIGRIGVLSDITPEWEMRQRVATFTRDIGNVLHTYESLLVHLAAAIKPMRATFAVETNGENTSLESLFRTLDLTAETLAGILTELIDVSSEETRYSPLRESDMVLLRHYRDLVKHYKNRITFPEFQAATLHGMALALINFSLTALPHKVNRDLIRRMRRESWKLARICSLISLTKIEDSVAQMDYQVRGLREYVTKETRRREPATIAAMDALVNQAISNLTYFAVLRRVEFKLSGPLRFARVRVQQREVVRAITNLLHNAVKYSWKREDERTWVAVRCRLEAAEVFLEIENYGVPIPREEIDSGLIFEIGMRGRLAGDRGRIGTGIGLGDAREVARAQAGEVTIESLPASAGVDLNDFSRPFLTTAEIRLPLCGEEAR